MNKLQGGGPAFPTERFDNSMRDVPVGYHGMTMRDWFAGQALIGLLAQSGGTVIGSDTKMGAAWAYEMADAMLSARLK